MPSYTVKCPNAQCEKHNEVKQITKKMSEDFPSCESCGTMTVSHFESAPSFALKGSGWFGKSKRG